MMRNVICALFIILCVFVSLSGSVPVRYNGVRVGTCFYGFGDGRFCHLNNVINNRAYMKCARYERGCLGRAIWRRGGHYRVSKRHNLHVCSEDRLHPLEMELRRRILDRCSRLDVAPFHQIIREEGRGFPLEVQLRVNYARMRTSMRNARLSNFPPPPQTLRELSAMLENQELTAATMTADGNDNLYSGSVTADDGSHCIIFSSIRMLQFAREQPIFFADGTFKTRPLIPESAQIFTIVTSVQHHLVPIAWILMESKTTSAYVAAFRALRLLLGPGVAHQQVITDYEAAQRPAWLHVFRNILLQGCLFHMALALVKYAKRNLNLVRFMRRGALPRIIRLCIGLCLVPIGLVDRAFAVITIATRNEGLHVYRRVQPFLDYVYRRWVNSRSRRAWMNCCGSENRSNNISESHNRQLSRLIGRQPDIYRFLMGSVELENDAHLSVNALINGVRMHRARRLSSVAMDNRLRNYLAALEPRILNNAVQPVPPNNQAILNFLQRASHLFDDLYDDALNDV